ncbi:MAG: sulfite exporter TauE/SafE family protein [Pseudomonadota bacterium]
MTEGAGFLAAWLLGLSLGLTACTLTCLPFMGAWVLARERGTVLADTGLFLAGRVSAYVLLGLVAGLAGAWLSGVLDSGIGHAVIGAAAVAAGLWLLSARPARKGCAAGRGAGAPPFALGFSLSLTPCAPLASLLAFAAQQGTAASGALQGLAFGLGAAVTPLVLLLPLLSAAAERLRSGQVRWGAWLRQGAAGGLLFLGTYRIAMGLS